MRLRVDRVPQRRRRVDAKQADIPVTISGRNDTACLGIPVTKERSSRLLGVRQVDAPPRRSIVRMPPHVTKGRVPEVTASNGSEAPTVGDEDAQKPVHLGIHHSAKLAYLVIVHGGFYVIRVDNNDVGDFGLRRYTMHILINEQAMSQCLLRHRGECSIPIGRQVGGADNFSLCIYTGARSSPYSLRHAIG